jgi:hypothetical protein
MMRVGHRLALLAAWPRRRSPTSRGFITIAPSNGTAKLIGVTDPVFYAP